jgi:hypothetical protein
MDNVKMKTYYGTKKLAAKPMTRQEYVTYRGWALPSDENGADTGYLVEYLDGGAANHKDHKGYISWSPKDVFDAAYQETQAMSFSHALQAIKEGKRVSRKGWNGKGMFLFLVAGSNFTVNREPLLSIMGEGAKVTYRPHIDMKDAEGKIVPWLASQTDILADDWGIVSI